jgi:hypothetical protein
MLNNQQFYDAQGAGDQMVCTESWKDNTLCKLPLAPLDDEPNAIDVEAALEQVKKNDSSLTELNLNKVYNIQIDTIVEFCEALKDSGNSFKRYFSPLLMRQKLFISCLLIAAWATIYFKTGFNFARRQNRSVDAKIRLKKVTKNLFKLSEFYYPL